MIAVGSLSSGAVASVDGNGTVERGAWSLRWRVRAGDQWLVPGSGKSVRQVRPGVAPTVRTVMRIEHGEVVHRAYAVSDGGGAVVVEVENDSADAIGVAFVPQGRDRWQLSWSGTPGATEPDGAMVFPLPHRQRLRMVLAPTTVDVPALPDVDAVERAWAQVLERGMRTELPEPLQSQIDAARADLLLAPASPAAFAALEAWGFDAEALNMWSRFGFRARRAARRGVDPKTVLGAIRAALVRASEGAVDVLPGFRPEWLGQQIAVHDIPLRDGKCSFAVRWHGERPALLWDVPPGTRVRAPVLDPNWSSAKPSSDALLAAPPSTLVAASNALPRSEDEPSAPADSPGGFS